MQNASSVTTIGEDVFRDCAYLTSVTIGKGMTEIAHGMFNNCIRLSTIKIPLQVNKIGSYAFFKCDKLNNVEFENPNGWTAKEESLFDNGDIVNFGELTDVAANAVLLRKTYYDYVWTRI